VPADGARAAAGRRGRDRTGGGRGRTGKRPVLRFVVGFAVLMGLFELACFTPLMNKTVFPAYLKFNAQASAWILGVLQENVTVGGNAIHGRYALTIEKGCDAIEPSALFLSGVVAFPTAMMIKLPGMLIGTFVLMVLNLVRIVSLYYIGVYFPRWFHFAHVDFWQSMFVFLAILFWILWALWASRDGTKQAHVAVEAD